ncbi:hypothetical protein MMC26_002131 [Xylographa opegraphella]|nr:hypothetical protein [Xylographa opegraphella]
MSTLIFRLKEGSDPATSGFMARLHERNDNEDELPELSQILVSISRSQHGVRNDLSSSNEHQGHTKEQLKSLSPSKGSAIRSLRTSPIRSKPSNNVETSSGDQQARIQKPLRLAHVNSLLLPTFSGLSRPSEKRDFATKRSQPKKHLRDIHGRTMAQKMDFTNLVADLRDALDLTEDDTSSENLSDFIVNDSASETDMEPPRSIKKYRSGSPRKPRRNLENNRAWNKDNRSRKPDPMPVTIDLISPDKKPVLSQKSVSGHVMHKINASPDDINDVDPFSNLRFSPPRSISPVKMTERGCLVTPPSSPSKPKLQSPTKSKPRIPPSPHRPSLDAFWSQDVINDWNDQYSPQKTPKLRRLFSVDEDDEGDISPSGSPRKSPLKSPAKKDKAAIERKRIFDKEKHDLATNFLEELDRTVANGQVVSLTAATGGIRIIWSKKLNSTAGRANWKREPIRTKDADGITSSTTYRHHAFIELAEKVIDDEDRLLNVLAHEYCHLANFMISNIKNNPHGKEFKEWAKKVSHAFADRNIVVTTKHTYAIAYKYIWACTLCGIEFKRHSKSIHPVRHTCGSCKGKLVQIQPAPRGGNGEGGKKAVSGYQAYVKEHYGRVKKANVGMGMGEIMVVLGKGYREEKEKRESEAGGTVTEVVDVIEMVGDGGGGSDAVEQSRAGADLDTVTRKLDFLSLKTGAAD